MSLVSVAVRMVVVMMMIVATVRAMRMRLGADALMVAVPVMRIAMMGMIMRAMIVVVMIVAVLVMIVAMRRRRSRDIGAAFGVERRLDRRDLGPEPARHILDDVIAADAQALSEQFGRQMPVAKVPGDAHQRRGVRAANFRQFFRRGDDLDDAPVLELEPVAGAQHHRFGQVEQKVQPAHGGHRDAPSIALVIIKHHRIGRLAGPGAGGTDGMSVDHGIA